MNSGGHCNYICECVCCIIERGRVLLWATWLPANQSRKQNTQIVTRRSLSNTVITPAHPHTHTHTLSLNERVIVSRQDGAAWAIAMGTVAMTNEGEVELLLDKYVIFSSMELVSEDVSLLEGVGR